jgi:hypothetical protein
MAFPSWRKGFFEVGDLELTWYRAIKSFSSVMLASDQQIQRLTLICCEYLDTFKTTQKALRKIAALPLASSYMNS